MSAFYSAGERLLNEHVLFDVLPDDIAPPEKLSRYKRVFTISSLAEMEGDSYRGLSRFDAPPEVRVSASNPAAGSTWDIHFVNYRRKDGDRRTTGLIADENPASVAGVRADLAPPSGMSITKIEWMTPEAPDPRSLEIERAGDRTRFTAPEFLVYGVARVHLARGGVTSGAKTGSAAPVERRFPIVRARSPVAALAMPDGAACDRAACDHTQAETYHDHAAAASGR
jgi:hypothetical protein